MNLIEDIKIKMNEILKYFIYFLNDINSLIIYFQKADNENNNAYTELIIQVNNLTSYAFDVLKKYINMIDILIINCKCLKEIVLSKLEQF